MKINVNFPFLWADRSPIQANRPSGTWRPWAHTTALPAGREKTVKLGYFSPLSGLAKSQKTKDWILTLATSTFTLMYTRMTFTACERTSNTFLPSPDTGTSAHIGHLSTGLTKAKPCHFCFFFSPFETGSPHGPSCPGTHYVGLELTDMRLPLLLECRD